jgi:hypothetical protein
MGRKDDEKDKRHKIDYRNGHDVQNFLQIHCHRHHHRRHHYQKVFEKADLAMALVRRQKKVFVHRPQVAAQDAVHPCQSIGNQRPCHQAQSLEGRIERII